MDRRIAKTNGVKKTKIAWITLATGNAFAKTAINWFKSSEKHFCTNNERFDVHLMVMTDKATVAEFERSGDSVKRMFLWTGVQKLGWPKDTLNKFKNLMDANKGEWVQVDAGKKSGTVVLPYSAFDFVYMTDADEEFRTDVCEDILGTRVSLAHPQYWDRALSADSNSEYNENWAKLCKDQRVCDPENPSNEEFCEGPFEDSCPQKVKCKLAGPFDRASGSLSAVDQDRINSKCAFESLLCSLHDYA
jgi:hypothetical protein